MTHFTTDGHIDTTNERKGRAKRDTYRSRGNRTPDKKSGTRKASVSNTSTIDPETCQICKVKYESPEDIETDSHWVNCGSKKGCTWWVHTICANIYYPNNDEGEKKLDAWASKHFYCKKHMPKAEKIGSDKELNREVKLGETSKKVAQYFKIKEKKIKKRTEIVSLPVTVYGSIVLHSL